jgi:SAM-dependent methyltransferase
MADPWWHRLLERPWIYRTSQAVLAVGGTKIDRVYDELWGGVRGTVLDVGCGPAPDTPLPDGILVGLDVNPAYVRGYVSTETAPMGVVASAAAIPFRDGVFDECRSAALLHHLPAAAVRETVREMYRTLRPGGRLAIFDMIRPPSFVRSPLGRLLCRLDRGAWVRPEAELVEMVREACGVHWETRTFSYSWARLEGIVLLARKPADG